MEIRVDVPFSKKKVARELGIRFDKQVRGWFAEENVARQFHEMLSEEVRRAEEEPSDTSGHTYMRNVYSGTQEIPLETVENEESGGDSNFAVCASTLDTTLSMASWIFKNGMPQSSSERTMALRVLGTRNPMQYPIRYDSMLCCQSFAELYPPARLAELIQHCITGAKGWKEEVAQSDLTEEEKALLFLALPLDGRS